jgi:hypothetical protein
MLMARADLAGAQQGLDGAQRLLQVHAGVVAVQVVQVQVVGAEPAQAGLARALDPAARVTRAVAPLTHGVAELAGQHPVLARAAAQQFAEHRLALAEGVDVRGVDEVDAVIARVRQDLARLGGGGLVGEHHGAQAQGGHFERAAAEAAVLHSGLRGHGGTGRKGPCCNAGRRAACGVRHSRREHLRLAAARARARGLRGRREAQRRGRRASARFVD